MADAPRVVAVASAIGALAISTIAVVVVVRRPVPEPVVMQQRSEPREQRLSATVVASLGERVTRASTRGVIVTDGELRAELGLDEDDRIVSIGGRPIVRPADVSIALAGLAYITPSTIFVEIVFDRDPELVRWIIDGDLKRARAAAVVKPVDPLGGPTSLQALGGDPDPLLDTIHKIDELHYEIPRSTIDRLLADTPRLASGARFVPSFRDHGIRLYAIRPSSVWRVIGLLNGDTLQSINGRDLSSPDSALQLYDSLKDAKELAIVVLRRGNPRTITISIL